MLLTVEQLNRIKQTISDYHNAFIVSWYGQTVLPKETVDRLRALGLVVNTRVTATDAYLYGMLLQRLNTPEAAKMSFAQFEAYVRKNPIPLSPVEEQAVNIAAARGAQYVVGLGNTVAQDTGRVAIEADAELRRVMKQAIRTTTAQGIAQRQSVKDIKSNLGHLTQDWTRDLDRIAATETSLAMNEGLAAQVRKDEGDDAEVSVLSRRGCCPECEKAYKGIDGAPIIFKLDDLEKNGTNYKKKKADKQAVVPPYHPNCVAPGTMVLTAHGLERIEHVTPGTLVYTDMGRLRPVTHTWASWHNGTLYTLASDSGPSLSLTGNHGVYDGLKWVPAASLTQEATIVRVSHVVQPPYLEDGYREPIRAQVLSGFYPDGAPITALILPSGVYIAGGLYEVGPEPRQPLAAALDGRLTFQNHHGLPALGVSQYAKLCASRFCDADGAPVVFARHDGDWAAAIHLAQAFFSRNFGCRDQGIKAPEDLTLAQLDGGLPGVVWCKKIELSCRPLGVGGFELSPTDEAPAGEGEADFAIERLASISEGDYRGFVYNLTVAGDHSYLANGIVVHNCACTLVHVPKGHGYTDDDRLSPIGKRGIRPHQDTAKSLLEQGEALHKADKTHGRVWPFYGLRLRGVHKLDTEGHYRAELLTPTGAVPCILGPNTVASDAYVAHLPTGDHVMLGFMHPHAAAVALNGHLGQKAMMSYPGHAPWSAIPAHQLAQWSGAGPEQALTMPGVGGSVGAQPLLRSARPKAEAKPRREPDAKLMLPVVPPRRTEPEIERPEDVLGDLRPPLATRKVKKMPKTAPWAMKPRVRDLAPKMVIGQPERPDPEMKALILNNARRKIGREPVTDIEVRP